MKIKQQTRDVVKSQEFQTIQYGVDASNLPMLFEMLRTNLYSDLHGSIIREVVSNVDDAHIEANKRDAIGEVEWISENRILGVDCQLIIRDFGIGLSPERMEKVYGNYLSSTKRDSNDLTGGFGLGSKAPFAYTDSFYVETIFDKIKYKYLCYIDGSGLGAISLLQKSETDKCNGTEIIIPIKNESNDFQQFQDSIIRQLSYFKNIKYIGFEPPKNAVLYEDEHCIILEEAPIEHTHVVLGKVAYEIDFAAAKLDFNEGHDNSGVGLKFPIGSLQPTLSRESLFWREEVKVAVTKKLEKARKSIRDELQKEIDAEKDWGRWYGAVCKGGTKRFPHQWNFSKIKAQAQMKIGKDLFSIQNKQQDWFAGHNVRKVYPFALGRRGSSSNQDYSTAAPLAEDLVTMPYYQVERNLNAKTCLWLFLEHPEGFIVVSEVSAPVEKELLPYYEQTSKWMKTLTSYDDLPVPDDAPGTVADYNRSAYMEKVKLRKLEGKFTAKKLVDAYNNMSGDLDKCFEYRMYESKFEDHKGSIIVYGVQEDHQKLCTIAAIMTLSEKYEKKRDDGTLLFLKVSQSNMKQFGVMPNAYYVDNVLDLKTPIKDVFAAVATAHRIKPYIHKYHILEFFHDVNADMQRKYRSLHKFVEKNAVLRNWSNEKLTKLILDLCGTTNLNSEMEDYFKEIVAYFAGAELLIFPNFAMYSSEHIVRGRYNYQTKKDDPDTPGTTGIFLQKYIKENKDYIKAFLIERKKQVDGGPVTPEPHNGSIPSDIKSITIAQQALDDE